MNDATESIQPTAIRGWLLVLCLMLVVVGPIISAGLMVNDYATFARYFAGSPGLQAAIFASLVVTACSVAYGVYAGVGLWLIRPKAVATAKRALLAGLAADIVTTVIAIVAEPMFSEGGPLLQQVMVSLVPSLIFFTLCFSYLQRSSRVEEIYGSGSD